MKPPLNFGLRIADFELKSQVAIPIPIPSYFASFFLPETPDNKRIETPITRSKNQVREKLL
jgi:hypothetical protein